MKLDNVVGTRKIWFLISIVLTIVSILGIVFLGFNKGIDFTSGTLYTVEFTDEVDAENIREFLKSSEMTSEFNLSSVLVQGLGDDHQMSLRVPSMPPDQQEQFMAALNEEFGECVARGIDQVDPRVGAELTRNAIISVILACVGILIYIGFRFEFGFAVAAIVCLLHDVLITLGVIAFTRQEINSAFIAGLLTIVGYSINDTIIIYDRVRENRRSGKYKDNAPLINASVSETLRRTLNTGVTTILAVLALFIFGSSTIRDFTLSMMVGITIGTYTSIFIASNIWYQFKGKNEKVSVAKK